MTGRVFLQQSEGIGVGTVTMSIGLNVYCSNGSTIRVNLAKTRNSRETLVQSAFSFEKGEPAED